MNLGYKKSRCIIGNPPYGDRNNLSRKFYKKSIGLGDYIAFILPISQLNNRDSLYEFDLIHSEDLGSREYSNRLIHCCFNIYKKPSNGLLNSKPVFNLKDVSIYRDVYKGLINGKKYKDCDYDLCIFRRCASAGKIKTKNTSKQTYKIIIHNDNIKNKIITTILEFDWINYKKHQSAPSISKNDIYRLLIEKIPEIK